MANTLKVHTVMIHRVAFADLDTFLTAEYGRDFDFIATQYASNESQYEFDITGKTDFYSEAKITQFKEGKEGQFVAEALMNDCAKRGVIPAGKYIVFVYF